MHTADDESRFDTKRLQSDMDSKGWLPVDLAREAGISHMTVHRFLSGERQTARMLKRMAVALGYSVRRYVVAANEVSAR